MIRVGCPLQVYELMLSLSSCSLKVNLVIGMTTKPHLIKKIG